MPARARWLLASGRNWQMGAEALCGPITPLLRACMEVLQGSPSRGGAVAGLTIVSCRPTSTASSALSNRSSCAGRDDAGEVVIGRLTWPWEPYHGASHPTSSGAVPATAHLASGPSELTAAASAGRICALPRSQPASTLARSPYVGIAAPCLCGRSRTGWRLPGGLGPWPGRTRAGGVCKSASENGGVGSLTFGSSSSSSSSSNNNNNRNRGGGAAAGGALGGVQPPAIFAAGASGPAPAGCPHVRTLGSLSAASAGAAAAAPTGSGDGGELSFVQVGRPVRVHTPPTPNPPATAPAAAKPLPPQASASTASTSVSPPRQGHAQPKPVEPTSTPTPRSTPTIPAAAAAAAVTTITTTAASALTAGLLDRIPIPPPSQRHQPPLPRDASKAVWRMSEELAAAGRLVRVQVGKGGVSRALVARAGHLLEHHSVIRLTLLQNCPLDVRFVAWLAENALDCYVIKVKGRTATLYRQKGLPRPPASFPEDPLAAQDQHQEEDSRQQTQRYQSSVTAVTAAGSSDGSGSSESAPSRAVRGAADAAPRASASVQGPAHEEGAPARRPTAAAAAATAAGTGATPGSPVGSGPGLVGYHAVLASRFRKWAALRETRRLRLGVRRREG